ncbi:phage major capsid protein [Lysinibacillus sp. NPDC094177]|uniref:phage major capsid protein n=1 Tax=Lysinibacillus sp. NPDC094177 TaxID=3390580 RepID=UPI003D08E2D6
MDKMELRFQSTNLRANKNKTLTVSGYVNKTGQLSNVIGTMKRFKEKIAKGAFQRSINKVEHHIDFLAEHDNNKILASTRNHSLVLHEDGEGLYMEATITPTSWGKDYYELINSGILKNMSFGFRTIKDDWKLIKPNLYERVIQELELFEVSVVKDPAYSQSTIAARGIDVVEEAEIPNEVVVRENEKYNNSLKEITNMKMEEYRYTQNKKDLKEKQRNVDYAEFNSIIRENRALQTTNEGASLIPENVADLVVQKMEDISPVFARAMKFPSTSGTLKIAREDEFAFQASFVGEGKKVIEGALALKEVKLEQKRYGAAIQLTNQLINDSAINIVNYVANLLARRVVKVAEKSILTGNSSEEFRGIIHDQEIHEVSVPTSVNNITYDYLLDLYNSVHPDYLSGVVFIVEKSAFNVISQLKDAAGHYYMQNGIVNGRPTRTLFGAEVFVTDSLPGTTPIVFGNIEQGYALMIKQAQGIRLIEDSQTALAGTKFFLYDIYADGAVYNPHALAKLTVTE